HQRQARRRAVLAELGVGEVQVQVVVADQLGDLIVARARLQARERDLASFLPRRADVAGEDQLALADDRDRLERRDRAAARGPAEHADAPDRRLVAAERDLLRRLLERAQLGLGARRRIALGRLGVHFLRFAFLAKRGVEIAEIFVRVRVLGRE